MKLQKYVKGFTLIELLVVIAIIGVLSTLAVVSLNSAREKSRNTSRVSNIKQIQNALEMDFNDNSSYLKSAAKQDPFEGTIVGGNLVKGIGSAMSTIPTAPNVGDGSCDGTAGNEKTYIYQSTNSDNTAACPLVAGESCGGYLLQFCLGSDTGTITAGTNCAKQSGIVPGPCTWK